MAVGLPVTCRFVILLVISILISILILIVIGSIKITSKIRSKIKTLEPGYCGVDAACCTHSR